MVYTVDLLDWIKHRYIAYAVLGNSDATKTDVDVPTLLDTGAFNSMIDLDLAKRFGTMLPIKIPISIGGNRGEARGCIIHKITLGAFEMTRVFALAYPFKDWLMRHVILGANVLNNWDFTTSRTENTVRLTEKIPPYVPNKDHPYQNYFTEGEYVAVQDEMLNPLGSL